MQATNYTPAMEVPVVAPQSLLAILLLGQQVLGRKIISRLVLRPFQGTSEYSQLLQCLNIHGINSVCLSNS
jgi:hypothetical protein